MEGSTTLETIKVARQFVTFFNYPLNLETDYEDIDGTHSEEEMQAMIVHGRSSAHSIQGIWKVAHQSGTDSTNSY